MATKPRVRLMELLPAVWFLAALCMFLLCNNITGFSLRSVVPQSQRRTQTLSQRGISDKHAAVRTHGFHFRAGGGVSTPGTMGAGHDVTASHAALGGQAASEERRSQVVRGKRTIMHRVKKKRHLAPPSFISPYGNRTQKFIVREETPSIESLLRIPLEMKLNYDTCARRSYPAQTDAPSPYSGAKLGIVVVVCNEGLHWIRNIPGGCQDKHVYLYSKCGVQEDTLYEAVGERLRKCTTVKMVPHTLVTDLTHVKMHADYLRHIISRYDELEPHLVFLKARVGDEKRAGVLQFQRHGKYDSPRSVREIVKVALTGQWAFLNVWPNRIHTSFEAPLARGRELCVWYKRYTCEAECYSCFQLNHPLCYIPQSKSMFIVSRARIRSLPSQEYVALHQWLVSYKDTFSGWLGHRRRYVMERLWPVVFGCNNDAHRFPTSYSTPAGCKEHQVFGDPQEHTRRAGLQPSPPKELQDLGQLTWPQPVNFTQLDYFPHIFTRTPAVSVVSALANTSHAEGQSMSFKAAVLTNPDVKLILLLDEADHTVQDWEAVEWAGRVEVQRLPVPKPPAEVEASPGKLEDWKTATLQALFLKQLASSEQQRRSSTGNLVFVKPHTMYYRPLRSVFDKRFTVAVSLQPEVDGKDLDLSTWFVHQSAVSEGARIMELVAGSYRDSAARTFKSVLEGCFQGAIAGVHSDAEADDASRGVDGNSNSALPSAGEDSELDDSMDEEPVTWQSSSKRCQLQDGTPATLLLLPCEVFNAEREECPPDPKAKVASVLRSRDNLVTERMWTALQKRSRASIVQFFTAVRQLRRRDSSPKPLSPPPLPANVSGAAASFDEPAAPTRA